MRALVLLWAWIAGLVRRAAALVACAIAALLPYRARALCARALHVTVGPGDMTQTAFMRLQLRFWNKVLLGLVFWGGLPPSRLLLTFWGRAKLPPARGAKSYWVSRESADTLSAGTRDPF